MSATAVATAISLEIQCRCHPQPAMGADDLYWQLVEGRYDDCSVMKIPYALEDWRAEHGTARKRADRASRRGYRAYASDYTGGEDWTAINLSADTRQGRPMSLGYRVESKFSLLPEYACPRHSVRVTCVMSPEAKTVAYLVMIRSGALALVSQILGHAEHLDKEVMFLLYQHALGREIGNHGFVVYNRHDSGTDGLRFFKERLGFSEQRVEWLP